ncbi:calcium-binding EF hand family protein [Salix suchowensis]|nr:calcium-binding EF hand family protein [Salix suchowensis]
MGRVVVYVLITIAIIVFIASSPINNHGRTPPGLNRRLGSKFSKPNFDPLAEAEDAGEYLSDDGRLNITLRLLVLFPLLDKKPRDGLISFEELEAWNVVQARERLAYRTQREIQSRDKDGDGAISFKEYLPQFSDEDIEKNEMGHGEAGWWMLQFRNADVDRNGTLDFDEFNNFLHPEDSNNRDIQIWILREKLKRMDDDRDGKLNLAEFSTYAYDGYKSYAEFEPNGAREELIPMIPYLKPGELSYARHYTSYLIHESDDNGDGNLSIDEMLNHEYTFYGTFFQDDEDYDDEFHDEL